MIKEIIISTACLTIGGFIGYKIGVNKAQKFADEQVKSTKESLKNYYEKKLFEKDEIIKKTAENMMPGDLGVDPGIDDEKVKDPREQFPRPFEAVQPKYKLSPDIKEKIKEDIVYKVSEKETGNIKKEDIVYKTPEKDKVMKRPNDLPPTAIDTPDGYPDPDDTSAEPYLIRDVDYGAFNDFELQELILWECGTVTTDDAAYDIVSPTYLFKVLPEGWIKWFGWGERYLDSLYFRNNAEKKDIQITKQYRTFRDWIEENYPGRLNELDED